MGKFVLFVETHRHAQVVLAEKQDVDAGDGGDFCNVLDARGSFNLQGHDAVVVVVSRVSQEACFVHAALRKVDGAGPCSGVLGTAHGLACFFRGVDVGDENAVGAHVEGLLNAGAVVVSAHADHGFCATVRNSGKHRRKFFIAHGAVLGVDEQPVIAAVGQLLGDGRAVRVQEQTHLG